MPYELLDAIEQLGHPRQAVAARGLPAAAARASRSTAPAQLAAWVERFFRLFARNQWKRERYAPSFHVDDLNLDPKTWCRFPILSGGFERELEGLRRAVVVEAEQRAVRGSVL